MDLSCKKWGVTKWKLEIYWYLLLFFIVLVATPSMAHSHDDNIESVAGNIHELAHFGW